MTANIEDIPSRMIPSNDPVISDAACASRIAILVRALLLEHRTCKYAAPGGGISALHTTC